MGGLASRAIRRIRAAVNFWAVLAIPAGAAVAVYGAAYAVQRALRWARNDLSNRPALWDRFYAFDWGDTTTNNYGYAPATGEGPQRFQYGECLAVRDTSAGPAIGCTRCGHTLCGAAEDPRRRALMVEENLSDLSPLNKYGWEDRIVIREYCCPGCATVFTTDVQFRTDDPAAPEMLLDPAQFAAAAVRPSKPRKKPAHAA